MILYDLAIMGSPSDEQRDILKRLLKQFIEPFGLRLGEEVGLTISPDSFSPPQTSAAAVAFFGSPGVSNAGLTSILRNGIPVIPISSAEGQFDAEIPNSLKALNGLTYRGHGPARIATALLECVGLLPRQRRVFLSYRRNEAREAALQLFDAMSARLFDVFLDTHGVPPAEDFQAVLWHRLCDSDVLVMLDTPTYFESRWTSAEFGRALAKGISVLSVGWPAVSPSGRTATASRINLTIDQVDPATGTLTEEPINRICVQLEAVRSRGHAVRSLNLFSNLQQAVEKIGGKVVGVGLHRAVYASLPDGRDVVIFPTVGVPTSLTMHDAVDYASGSPAALVYDHIGLSDKWLKHLAWLGTNIRAARWVKASEAAWDFADWEV